MGSQESGNSYTECICGLVVCAMCTHHLLGKLNHFWMQISATASKTPSTSKLWSYILHNLLLKYFLPAQSKHHFLKQRFFFFSSAGSKVMLFTCTYRLSPTNWSWLSSLCYEHNISCALKVFILFLTSQTFFITNDKNECNVLLGTNRTSFIYTAIGEASELWTCTQVCQSQKTTVPLWWVPNTVVTKNLHDKEIKKYL